MAVENIPRSVDIAMKFQGKSNKELAELLNTSESRASLLRNGKAELDVPQLYTVAHWLGYSTDDLARGLELVPAAA